MPAGRRIQMDRRLNCSFYLNPRPKPGANHNKLGDTKGE